MNAHQPKKFSRGRAIALSITLGLLVACVSITLQLRTESLRTISGTIGAAANTSITTASASSLGSSFTTPATPVRLIIPAIGVNAAIQTIGMSHNGLNIGIPSNFTDVGWFKYGPVPGAPGTAIIDGHLDGVHVPVAVFFNLQNLVPGDSIQVVDASGTVLRFVVTASKAYDYTASTTDIFSSPIASSSYLNLITCAGDWDAATKNYSKRIVVFSSLVSGS